MSDIVDEVVGSTPATLAARARRPVTVEQLQASYDALFSPVDVTAFSLAERDLVAAFTTTVTADDALAAHYVARARDSAPELVDAVVTAARNAQTTGPFGTYREVGLVAESTDGERLTADALPAELGERLTAALVHAHLLVFRPREADDAATAALLSAGFDADGVVTLAQLISFLAFQQRVTIGLAALQEELA